MNSTNNQVPNTTIQNLWFSIRWAIKQTWVTSPPLTTGIIGITLLRSITPVGLVLTLRGLIDALAAVLNNDANDIRLVWLWLGFGATLTLIHAISTLANQFFVQRLRDELNLKLTSDILNHAAGLDVAFFEDLRFQDVMDRAQESMASHFIIFMTNALTAVTSIIQIISLVAVLAVVEPLIVLIMIPVALPYLLFRWYLSKLRYSEEYSRVAKRRWTRYYIMRLTHQFYVSEVKLLDLAPLLIERFRAFMIEFRDHDSRIYWREFTGSILFNTLLTLAFYIAFARVLWRALAGALTIGDVTLYGGAAAGLRNALHSAIMASTTMLRETLYILNMITFLSLKPQLVDTVGMVPLAPGRGEIELKNVSFTYSGSNQPVLSNISLHIKSGETIALVGENGAGKTTLVKLIARLYDPNGGCIVFDGVDLRKLSSVYLREQMSFVFQTFDRYETTAAENIAYGDWRRLLHDRERIELIARLANVHEMIEAMPQGYDTQLGRMFGQHQPSGGQWQKIAVARAFARDASLLILDEPTANLDARAEYELFSRFQELSRGRTTILISHRFSTVSMADRILVMDKGRIVEWGTHQELLIQAGQYADLYNLHQYQMSSSMAE